MEGTFPDSSFQTTFILTTKPHKDPRGKENYRSIFLMIIDLKLLNKNFKTKDKNILKRLSNIIKLASFQSFGIICHM